ncbi:MAG: RNA-directed DNA polymerase [Ruminococcaceae bacterium]|nr:RNA-directed DNA polymerase [Oscillospiraceae bacterium]
MIVRKDGVVLKKEDDNYIKKFGLMKAAEIAIEYKQTHKTPFIHDLFQLAAFIGPGKRSFFKLLKNVNNEYSFFEIKKKNGGFRKIYAPSPELCRAQRVILRGILSCYDVSPYASAYIEGKGLISNAQPHTNKKYILKMDITDFFGSISFEQVISTVFNKNYFPSAVGYALTTLCCYKGYLVQGAPTSPMISNLVLKHFDDVMGVWCEKRGISYSRYCDDITFSANEPLFCAYSKAKAFLSEMGFEINKKKTRFVSHTSQQNVTGLVVNEKVSVPKEYKRDLRQKIYYFLKFDKKDTAFKQSGREYYSYINYLLGRANYVLSIEPNDKFLKESILVLREKSDVEYWNE